MILVMCSSAAIFMVVWFLRSKHGYRLKLLFQEYGRFSHAMCTSDARLDGKTTIITGSNTGIGKVTALDFCKRGARVIMACRNVKKGEEAAQEIRAQISGLSNAGVVVVKELDLASFKSTRKFAKEILDTESQINILVNNAGVMLCPRQITEDGHELHFQSNHLGHFLLTMLLLPRILSSAPARIINVTSVAHFFCEDGDMQFNDVTLIRSYSPGEAYARSKLANVLFTKKLAQKLEGTGVTTYAVHPGTVDTELPRHMGTATRPFVQRIYQSAFFSNLFLKTPEQGAQTTLHCSLTEEAGKENGLYYSECKPEKTSEAAKDEENASALWEFSWTAVGLSSNYNPFVKE